MLRDRTVFYLTMFVTQNESCAFVFRSC